MKKIYDARVAHLISKIKLVNYVSVNSDSICVSINSLAVLQLTSALFVLQ